MIGQRLYMDNRDFDERAEDDAFLERILNYLVTFLFGLIFGYLWMAHAFGLIF